MHRMRRLTIKSRGKLMPVSTKCLGVAAHSIEVPSSWDRWRPRRRISRLTLAGRKPSGERGHGGVAGSDLLEKPGQKATRAKKPRTSSLSRSLCLPGKEGILGSAEAANGWERIPTPTWPPASRSSDLPPERLWSDATILTWILNRRKLVTSCSLDGGRGLLMARAGRCICRNCRREASSNRT